MYVGPGIVNIIFTHKNAEVNNIYPCFSFYAFILGRITYFKRIFFFIFTKSHIGVINPRQ